MGLPASISCERAPLSVDIPAIDRRVLNKQHKTPVPQTQAPNLNPPAQRECKPEPSWACTPHPAPPSVPCPHFAAAHLEHQHRVVLEAPPRQRKGELAAGPELLPAARLRVGDEPLGQALGGGGRSGAVAVAAGSSRSLYVMQAQVSFDSTECSNVAMVGCPLYLHTLYATPAAPYRLSPGL
jgi:hypothetical protein